MNILSRSRLEETINTVCLNWATVKNKGWKSNLAYKLQLLGVSIFQCFPKHEETAVKFIIPQNKASSHDA